MTLLGLLGIVICVLLFVVWPYFEYGRDMTHPWLAPLIFPGVAAALIGLIALLKWMSTVQL
jgi:Na+/proline symporter